MRRIASGALAALAVLGLAGTAEARRANPEEQLAKILKGRVAGPAEDCIYLPSIRSSRIVDRTAIVYDAGRVLWVNRPESGASSLDDDAVMVTKTHNSQLCSIDVVRLHDRSQHSYRGFVGLAKFVPYRKAGAVD